MTSEERPEPDPPDDAEPPQLAPDVDDPEGGLPSGEAQDRRGPETPEEDLLRPG